MIRISEFLLNFVVNAAWQTALILVVASLGARFLRNAPARYRHVLWITALGFSLIAPAVSTMRANSFNVSVRKAQSSAIHLVTSPQPQTFVIEPDESTGIERLLTRRRQTLSVTPAWLFVLSGAYLLVLVLQVVRLARMWRRKEKLRQEVSRSASIPMLETIARQCRHALDLSNAQVVCSKLIEVPATLGVMRPVIVLPERLCAELDEEALSSIVGHEMAHVARRDFLTNLLCELVCVPISFHPLTYLFKRQIRRTRELACDELVARHILKPRAYARSLVRIANTTFQRRAQALTLSIFDGNILEHRIMKLTQKQRQLGLRAGRVCMVVAILALCAVCISTSMLALDLRAYSKVSHAQQAERAAFPVSNSQAESVSSPNQRAALKQLLDSRGSQAVDSSSAQSIDSPTAQELAQDACAAGLKGDVEAIPKLVSLLGDDRRIEPIKCSYSRWSPALETFKHPSPGEQAAIALASMGRRAFPALSEQLTSSNSTVRYNAAWAIGELTAMIPGERAAAVPQLIFLLRDADKRVQMAAARTLGEVRDERAGEPLIGTLLDSDPRVRQMAAWALSELKDRRAVQELCRVLLSDAQPEVRRGAAEALGEINSSEALPSLKQALNDPETSVRAKVGWAISEIEG
ncbi:MAG: HEAT repeat domain-containing protein [Acidobacteriota bacterium]